MLVLITVACDSVSTSVAVVLTVVMAEFDGITDEVCIGTVFTALIKVDVVSKTEIVAVVIVGDSPGK